MVAKRERSCDLCGVTFDYPSKYKRHLESESHKRFEENIHRSMLHEDPIDLEDEHETQHLGTTGGFVEEGEEE